MKSRENRSIKIMRVLAGLTQAELAEKIQSYQVRIHRIETGQAQPKPEELQRLREILLSGQASKTA